MMYYDVWYVGSIQIEPKMYDEWNIRWWDVSSMYEYADEKNMMNLIKL